jgi:hypothetical protein
MPGRDRLLVIGVVLVVAGGLSKVAVLVAWAAGWIT